jgi:hypothetical protein
MAITQVNVSSPSNEIIFSDTAISNAVDAVKASSAKLFWLTVDNTLNVAASYLKLYNVASGSVTVGTTAPDMIIYCPPSVITYVNFGTGVAPGITFGTALTAACVTTAGTAGNTGPSSNVTATLSYV